MPTLQTALTFFGVSVLLALSPGPDNVFVLFQSIARGPLAGMRVVLGLCTGLIVHTSAVALGLAALFAASAVAFALVKWCGALYLAYLAVQAFRASGALPAAGETAEDGRRMFVRGIVMNLTNPKVAIFFLAFLPQFTRPEQGAVAVQMLWLGAIFIVATALVFGAIAYFSGWFGQRLLRSERAGRVLNRLAGVVFLGLAVRLASAER